MNINSIQPQGTAKVSACAHDYMPGLKRLCLSGAGQNVLKLWANIGATLLPERARRIQKSPNLIGNWMEKVLRECKD